MRVLFSASGKSPTDYTSTLSFGDRFVNMSATVQAPQTFTVSNIALSADNKSFTVTGTGLNSVASAMLLQSNKVDVIDTLVIDTKTPTQLILKPSKDLTLPAGDVVMRIQ